MPVQLDFCSYNFYIFRFSRSGKGEVQSGVWFYVQTYFRSLCAFFYHDHLSRHAVDASSCMKLILTKTESPRFDATLRNKGYYVSLGT